MTVGSLARVEMFFAPCCGLCTPLTASSCWLLVTVNPGTGFFAMASATPFAVGTPFGASPPVIGSSIPILTAMLPAAALAGAAALAAALAATLGAAAALGDGVALPLHAETTIAATAMTAPTRATFMSVSSSSPRTARAAVARGDRASPVTVWTTRIPPQGHVADGGGIRAGAHLDSPCVAAGEMPYISQQRPECNTASRAPAWSGRA